MNKTQTNKDKKMLNKIKLGLESDYGWDWLTDEDEPTPSMEEHTKAIDEATAELETIQRDYVLIKIADVPDGIEESIELMKTCGYTLELYPYIGAAKLLHKAITEHKGIKDNG